MEKRERNLIILLLYEAFGDKISLRRVADLIGTTPSTVSLARNKIDKDRDGFIKTGLPSDFVSLILERVIKAKKTSPVVEPQPIPVKPTKKRKPKPPEDNGLSLFKPDQSKGKRSGRVSWGDKDPDTLEDVGLVYYHFERIRMGKTPYKKEFYSTKTSGNFGKAGNLIKDAIRRGYNVSRLVPSIIEYHEDNDKWVEGHPIDKWASQIDKYVKRSEAKSKSERKKHYIDPNMIEQQEAEELEKYKNGIRRRKNTTTP